MATRHILLLASKSNTRTEQGESDGAEIRAVRLEKDMELSLSAGKVSPIPLNGHSSL